MSTQFGDTRRTLSTGDLVISVNEIFDRLQTKVDPNTLEQLLRDILAGRRNQVRPGELITAELINQILAELESLQVRVTKLEAGGVGTPTPVPTPVEINDVLPHGTRTVNDEITVVGKNFVTPVEGNQVKVGPRNILLFKPGNDASHLIFDIPDLTALNLSPTGSPVAISVQNKNGTDSFDVQIKPLPTFPKGTVVVQYTSAPIVALVAGETVPVIKNGLTYDFVFTIATNVDKEASYNLTPTVTGAGWTARVLNDTDQQITQMPISAGPQQRLVRLRVSSPAAGVGAASTTLRLEVTESSGAGGVPPDSDQFTITIGQAVPAPNTSFSIGLRDLPTDVTIAGGRIVFPIKESAISVNVGIAAEGTFNVSASFRNPTGWSTREPFITGQSVVGPISRDFSVHVIATATSQPTELLISVRRTSAGSALSTIHAHPIRAVTA